MEEKKMESELNIAHSLFPGLNDNQGIMICGYEWGDSLKDQEKGSAYNGSTDKCTFANKEVWYGDRAKKWRYDQTIRKWFKLWGHALQENGKVGDFERCIVQTNWCASFGNKIEDNIHNKLREGSDNFIEHIRQLRPLLIFFMGAKMIEFLNHKNNHEVMDAFTSIMGEKKSDATCEKIGDSEKGWAFSGI